MNSLPASAPDFEFDPIPLRRPLIAVLPFTSDEGDEPTRLLAGELADAVREGLGRDPAFGAILISSQFLERAPEHALELICRQLHVGHLVAGHCYRGDEDGASLYLELTDTRNWYVRWAQFFRGSAGALLGDGAAMATLQASLQAALAARPAP